MRFKRTKKYVGLFLALCIVFGYFIFKPNEVKADSGVELGTIYTVTQDDYKYQFNSYGAAFTFIPEESGYYSLDSEMGFYIYYYDNLSVDYYGSPNGFNTATAISNFHALDAEQIFENQKTYYLENGITYYLVHLHGVYSTDNPYGSFCLRKTNDYLYFYTPNMVDVILDQDAVFTTELVSTVECENVSIRWNLHGSTYQTDNATTSTCLIPSDKIFSYSQLLSFEGSGWISGYVYCYGSAEYNGTKYEYSFAPKLKTYTTELSKMVWAEAEYESWVSWDDYEDKYYAANAGSYLDGVEISYQWYWREDYRTLVLLEGQTNSYLPLKVLPEPEVIPSYNNTVELRDFDTVCKVTFKYGDQTTVRSVYCGSYIILAPDCPAITHINANYGDTIKLALPEGYADDLREGFSYNVVWLDSELDDISDAIWYQNYRTIATDVDSVSVDTSELYVLVSDEENVSYVAVQFLPYYQGVEISGLYDDDYIVFKIHYTDTLHQELDSIAVDSTNFPDNNFRQYVSENFDTNGSGYLSHKEIDSVRSMDLTQMGIRDLTGINFFTNLRSLYVSGNYVSELDLSGLSNLKELRCDGMGLSSLNLSGCGSLKTVYMNDNALESVNIDDCPYLVYAYENGPQSIIRVGQKFYGVLNYNVTGGTYILVSGLLMDEDTEVENHTPVTAEPTDIYIFGQPEDYEGWIGGTAVFEIFAEGRNNKYQWQYLDTLNPYRWCNVENETARTDTLLIPITEVTANYKFRCVISDGTGLVQSEYAKIKIVEVNDLEIIDQPVDLTCIAGEMATFTVEAEGDGLEYQWQVLKDNEWVNCSNKDGAKTATLTLEAKESRSGAVYQCVITDAYGQTATTDPATLTVTTPLYIITQPEDFSGDIGEKAIFTVEAAGKGLKYQWQSYKNGSWTNCSINDGARSATLSLDINSSRHGSKYQCVITDKNGETVTSDTVMLTLANPITIVKQPEDSYVYMASYSGCYACFTVEAEGQGLKYQWQMLKNGVWTNCSMSDGAKTKTLEFEIKPSRVNTLYHCIITDKTGATVITNDVTLTVDTPLHIVSNPDDFIGAPGEMATFTVEAEGEGLKYQWQVYKNGEWVNCSVKDGAKTDTLTLEIKDSRDGNYYRCVIKDSFGSTIRSNGWSQLIVISEPNIPVRTTESITSTSEVCAVTVETEASVPANVVDEAIDSVELINDVEVIEAVPEVQADTVSDIN